MNFKKNSTYYCNQIKFGWTFSQTKQTFEIFKLSFINFKNRLGVTFLLLLVIYILSILNFHNQNFSNLRWVLIGTFASALATIIFLDAYNKYLKIDTFGIVYGRSIENLFFRLNIIIQTLSIAFIENYNLGRKRFFSDFKIDTKLFVSLKEELNKPENQLFLKNNNIIF